jgi:hypothetical protein
MQADLSKSPNFLVETSRDLMLRPSTQSARPASLIFDVCSRSPGLVCISGHEYRRTNFIERNIVVVPVLEAATRVSGFDYVGFDATRALVL